MRTTSPRIIATATAAAALLVLLFLATGPAPSRLASSELNVTSNCITESFCISGRYATISEASTVWVASTATPFLATNASYTCIALDDPHGCTVGSLPGYTILPYFRTVGVSKTTSTSDGRTTTTTNNTRRGRKNRRMSTATTAASATRSDPSSATTSRTMIFHDRFDGAAHEDTSNESGWTRFRHEPLRLPDQFMARFLNTLMYLAEVITADVISAFLFGRWRPRYHQRAKKNRLDRTRRRRYRRFMRLATDMATMILDACVRLHDTLCPMQNDVSRPTFRMVSNVQLTEYPATLSTFADVPTSDVVAIVASVRSSALVSMASSLAPTSALPDLPLFSSDGAQVEAATAGLRPAVSSLKPRSMRDPEISDDASYNPRASLPDTGLQISLRSAVSHQSPLLLEAGAPTTGPSLSKKIGVLAGGHEEVTFRARRLLTSMCPSSTSVTTGCAVNNAIMPIMKDSSTERECLAVLGINLLLEASASPPSPTIPSTRKLRPTILASETNSGNAEGMANSLVIYTTAERSTTTPMEEFGGPADGADDTPPAPFFISERYTPESTCYVSAHGVAYTTITMSYVHRVNLPTSRGSQDDTPTTTQTGDVSDILFPASNARVRCKWSRECIQSTSSEYYSSSVEAVFVARFIPDETDMVVLSDLVTRHL